MMRTYKRATLTLFAVAILSIPSHATSVVVTVENLQPSDGFFFTPVWTGFHDGGFDLFDAESTASNPLETIAETGDTSPLSDLFTGAMNDDGTPRVDTVIFATDGFGGAPVFDPGEKVSTTIRVSDPGSNRYLSFISMVIPSNDAFFGSPDPMAYEVFDIAGRLAAPLTVEIRGNGIYDAGTELNNGLGAAFSTVGGESTDESMTVASHAELDHFVDTSTPAGTTIQATIDTDTLLARIQIRAVPEPSSVLLLGTGLVALGLVRSTRRIDQITSDGPIPSRVSMS